MVLALFSAMAAGAAPAQAATVAPAAMAVSVPMTGGMCAEDTTAGGANFFLAVDRWSSATGNIHTHVDNAFFGEQDKIASREALTAGLFSSANSMWSVTSGLTDFSIRYCAFDAVSQQIDEFVASIGRALGGSGLLTILVVFTLISAAWKWRKGDGSGWKQIISKVGIAALMVAMVVGASVGPTTVEKEIKIFNWTIGTTTEEVYVPGFLSPGWIITTANSSLTSLASAPAAALIAISDPDRPSSATNKLSCANYLDEMDASYKRALGDGANQISASVPLSISRLWEGTVLRSWQGVQYGTAAIPVSEGAQARTYSDNVYCHHLEWKSVAPLTTREDNWNSKSTTGILARVLGSDGASTSGSQDFMRKALGVGDDNAINAGSVAPSKALQPVDNENTDRSIMAWAQCQIGGDLSAFTINPYFSGIYEGKTATPEDCMAWWTTNKKVSDNFDYDQNPGKVVEKSKTDTFANFVNTTHGYEVFGGLALGLILNFSSLAMMVVFGLLALSVLIAKTLLALVGLGLFFSLVAALLPGKGFDQILKMINFMFGIILLVIFTQFFYSVIVSLTGILVNGSSAFIETSSTAGIIWSGFAPLVVVAGLGMIFKKFNVPNPLSLKSGMAWGKKIANGGGSAAAGSSGMGRMARNAQRRAMRRQGAQMRRAIHGNGRGRSRGGVGPTGSQAEKLSRSTNKPVSVPDGKESGVPVLDQASKLPNSQAAKIARNATERKALRTQAAGERREAVAWQKTERERLITEAGGNPDHKFRNFSQDAMFDMGQKFRSNPLGMAKRGALATGAVGAAMLAAPVALPVAAVAGAAALAGLPLASRGMSNFRNQAAAKGWGSGNKQTRARMDEIVKNYRAHQREEVDSKMTQPSAPSTPGAPGSTRPRTESRTSRSNPVTTPPTKEPSRPAPPRTHGPAAPAVSGSARSSIERGGGNSDPVTMPNPVVTPPMPSQPPRPARAPRVAADPPAHEVPLPDLPLDGGETPRRPTTRPRRGTPRPGALSGDDIRNGR